MYENRALRRIFGLKREEVTGAGEKYIMGNLVICTIH
jgi:PAS domain-containing protein